MPDITIEGPPGDVDIGDQVELIASVKGAVSDYTYRWERPDAPDHAEGTLKFKVEDSSQFGTYTAHAKSKAGDVELTPKPYELKKKAGASEKPPADAGEKTRELLIFDAKFAGLMFFAVVLVGVVVLFPVGYMLWDIGLKSPDTDRMVVITTLGLLAIGTLVMLFGVYAGLLEVRGRLRSAEDRKKLKEEGSDVTKRGPAEEVAKVLPATIEAIGKLSGAALILVVACVPLIAAAWIAESKVSNEEAPTASPTATVAANDGSSSAGGSTDIPTEPPTPRTSGR